VFIRRLLPIVLSYKVRTNTSFGIMYAPTRMPVLWKLDTAKCVLFCSLLCFTWMVIYLWNLAGMFVPVVFSLNHLLTPLLPTCSQCKQNTRTDRLPLGHSTGTHSSPQCAISKTFSLTFPPFLEIWSKFWSCGICASVFCCLCRVCNCGRKVIHKVSYLLSLSSNYNTYHLMFPTEWD
jgi:hypothetical protein